MNYQIRWLPSAAKGLQSIRDYLDENAPDKAIEIVTAIRDAALSLLTSPMRYPSDLQAPDFRRIIVQKKYKVFYKVNEAKKSSRSVTFAILPKTIVN